MDIAVFMKGITTDGTECNTWLIIQEILSNKIDDEEHSNFVEASRQVVTKYIKT